ncbi:MAG: ATPase P [Bacteroidetes bacterium]|nr:MAG: ATPase P [Bacteroidota bacterium]
MLTIDIPGQKTLQLTNLVLDYNGTLAVDGTLIPGVSKRLNILTQQLTIHVVTANTFGKAAKNLQAVNCQLTVLSHGNQQQQKADFVLKLGEQNVVAIGNGLNDALMLKQAALGLVVIQQEGVAIKTWQNADVALTSINDALDLLLNPLRLKATVRV